MIVSKIWMKNFRLIKIKTTKETTPIEAFREALKNLNDDIDDCIKQLDEQFQNYKK